ncbi:hypothetical protein ON010_g9770 [Phytophthora cinnamomi]|nr:hypothetical protein ON010_g9770 [Phytophthora cinnamomi]
MVVDTPTPRPRSRNFTTRGALALRVFSPKPTALSPDSQSTPPLSSPRLDASLGRVAAAGIANAQRPRVRFPPHQEDRSGTPSASATPPRQRHPVLTQPPQYAPCDAECSSLKPPLQLDVSRNVPPPSRDLIELHKVSPVTSKLHSPLQSNPVPP